MQEVKNDIVHYFIDELGRIQGKYKSWYQNGRQEAEMHYVDDEPAGLATWWFEDGRIAQQCSYSNNELHGEYKEWWEGEEQEVQHQFYDHNEAVTDDIKTLVNDISYFSPEEKLIIKLKYGHDFNLLDD